MNYAPAASKHSNSPPSEDEGEEDEDEEENGDKDEDADEDEDSDVEDEEAHGGAAGEQEGSGDGKIDKDVRIIAPNSCPPESVFSMFNATFGEDQSRSFGDYLEPAMQSQYNKRNL